MSRGGRTFDSFADFGQELGKEFGEEEREGRLNQAEQLLRDGRPVEAVALLDQVDLKHEPEERRKKLGEGYWSAAKVKVGETALSQAKKLIRQAQELGFNGWQVSRRLEVLSKQRKQDPAAALLARLREKYQCESCDKPDADLLACAKCSGAIVPQLRTVRMSHMPPPYSLGVYRYQGDAQSFNILSQIIRHLKGNEGRSLCEVLAYMLALGLRRETGVLGKADVVIPVPPDPERIEERGFDNVAVMAEHLEAFMLVPLKNDLLRKAHGTADLRGIPRGYRRYVLSGSIVALEDTARWVQGLTVLLVDDIVTSGATLDTCAQTLMENGAKEVLGATVACSESTRESQSLV
ncbi:MAG TPA: hypothetical protein PK280_10630 [Planctomycetota bacterium]|nr:hypothetical protein [Planctomycetota bacterium]